MGRQKTDLQREDNERAKKRGKGKKDCSTEKDEKEVVSKRRRS